ncbi:hypothetical protein ACIQU5_32010 [Streptomyces sp. NPDC090306]|uniref:hypothetical protein n=1 Tax=Streptomyces sp. NPDC090306 TaxID=3365961 RepID=UPI00381B8EE1
MSLSADAILNAEDVQYRIVPCPEWGGDVRVRSLSGAQRDDFEASVQQLRTKPNGDREVHLNRANQRARLLVLAIVDDDGKLLFKPTDANALGKKNGAALDRLWDAVTDLSGMGDNAADDAEGNSDAAQSGDSSSSSPENSDAPSSSWDDDSAPES